MSVSDHMRAASAELLKAADLVKIEIDDLRKQETQSRHDVENTISQLTIQLQHTEHDFRSSDDTQQRSSLQSTVALLQKQIADKQSELREMERTIQNSIDEKNRMVSQLESQARSINP